MDKIIVKSQHTVISRKVLRYVLFTIGVALFVFPDYIITGHYTLPLKLIGVLLFIPAVTNPFSLFGGNDTLILTDDFIKLTDEMTITRSAYWNKLDCVILTRFSLQVHYKSGAGENFKIPHINKNDFEELRSEIIQKSREYEFEVQEQPWWKITS